MLAQAREQCQSDQLFSRRRIIVGDIHWVTCALSLIMRVASASVQAVRRDKHSQNASLVLGLRRSCGTAKRVRVVNSHAAKFCGATIPCVHAFVSYSTVRLPIYNSRYSLCEYSIVVDYVR